MDIKEIINQRYAMPDASLDRLQQCLTEVSYPKGFRVLKCGKVEKDIFFIKQGIVRIIRKTKRFAIPERAVYFLKTKRTAGGTLPPQNIFDRLTPVFTQLQERSPNTIRTPFFSFCRFAPALRASRYAASLNALYAATLCALTSLPRKARREPTYESALEAP